MVDRRNKRRKWEDETREDKRRMKPTTTSSSVEGWKVAERGEGADVEKKKIIERFRRIVVVEEVTDEAY